MSHITMALATINRILVLSMRLGRVITAAGVKVLLLFQLLYLVAVLDLVYKDLGRFEAGHKVLVDHQSGIAGNVAGYLFLALFVDKAAKTTNVDVVAIGHGGFHNAEECLHRCGNVGFIYPSLFSDFIDDVCFGHSVIFLSRKFFREGKFKGCPQN